MTVIQRPSPRLAASTEVGTATLWVIDEAGKPQASTLVTLASAARMREFSALTDERGAATITDIPTGRYHASARPPGLTSDAILVDVTMAPPRPRSIVVRPQPSGAPHGATEPAAAPQAAETGSATLWVIDEAGKPQAFADVTLASVDKTSERSALTDERGRVEFTNVAVGSYHASARLEGFTSDAILVEVTTGPALTRSIVLHAASSGAPGSRDAGVVTLWVIDDTGKPRPSVKVILDPVGDGRKVSLTTDAAGRVVVPDLPPGGYHARASLKRFTSDTVLVEVGAPARAYSIAVQPLHRRGARERSKDQARAGGTPKR